MGIELTAQLGNAGEDASHETFIVLMWSGASGLPWALSFIASFGIPALRSEGHEKLKAKS